MLGDTLYKPSLRDIVTVDAAPRRLNFRATASAVAAAVSIDGPIVPADEAWIITQIYAQATPGAAQTVVNMIVSVILGGVSFNEAHGWTENFSATPAIAQVRSVAGVNFALMPGEVLRLNGNFNAGANSNLVLLNALGVALPRGNLIR